MQPLDLYEEINIRDSEFPVQINTYEDRKVDMPFEDNTSNGRYD